MLRVGRFSAQGNIPARNLIFVAYEMFVEESVHPSLMFIYCGSLRDKPGDIYKLFVSDVKSYRVQPVVIQKLAHQRG